MIQRRLANWIRFVLGVAMALGLGIDSYVNQRGVGLTYILPIGIGLIALADLVGYLSNPAKQLKARDADSSAEPGGAPDRGGK